MRGAWSVSRGIGKLVYRDGTLLYTFNNIQRRHGSAGYRAEGGSWCCSVLLICMRDCWHSNVPVISVLVCYKTTVIYWHSRNIKTKINADKVEHQGQGFIWAALEVKLRVFDPEAGTLYYQRVCMWTMVLIFSLLVYTLFKCTRKLILLLTIDLMTPHPLPVYLKSHRLGVWSSNYNRSLAS